MLRYEQRVPPGKLEVWAVEDWPEWRASPGHVERTVVIPEEYYLLEGRLRIHIEGQPPIDLQGGDWFALESGTVCAIEALEPTQGYRQIGV